TPVRRTTCPTSGPIATFRTTCSRSATRAGASPALIWQAAFCCGIFSTSPSPPSSSLSSPGMGVDLLVFGPHPDDIEIGIGGVVAHHATLGLTVGLCDLTAADLASNGTVDERLKEADAAGKVLGAAWRAN